MGSIVWDDGTTQFTRALVTRSNIAIATSCFLFIVILVPQIGCGFLLFAIFDCHSYPDFGYAAAST